MRQQKILGPEEVVEGRPFTDPVHSGREAEVMRQMLEHERERAREWSAELTAAGPRGRVVRDHDERGHRHLIVVPDTRALVEAQDVSAVGFFSRPREGVDHAVLFALEEELVERMPAYADAGLLSYYDVELVKGAYGNLILFSTPDVPEAWAADTIHRRAVEMSPSHYYDVRLHKGSILGPLLGQGKLVIERTKYFDFEPPGWRGVRHFEPA